MPKLSLESLKEIISTQSILTYSNMINISFKVRHTGTKVLKNSFMSQKDVHLKESVNELSMLICLTVHIFGI